MSSSNVLIIGGGFGGLAAARSLQDSSCDITLIDKTNHHLFQPLLYQVAVAALSRGDIATPFREIFRGQTNVHIIMDEVQRVSCKHQVIELTDTVLPFSYLVVAPGSQTSFFGHHEWKGHVRGLKTLYDATKIRDQILHSFEKAERLLPKEEAKPYLTFIVVGGGPTGVELAGALAEIVQQTIRPDFPDLKDCTIEIILLQAESTLITGYPENLAEQARKFLQKMGVTFCLNSRVTNISESGVQAGEHVFSSKNIFWAAGNAPSPLLKTLDVPTDYKGRIRVNPDLSVPGWPNIFVIGDSASCVDSNGLPLPELAAVATQQGHYVAKAIRHGIPPENRQPFRYHNLGEMATIGRAKAVANIQGWHLSGFVAWLLWSVVHIFYLIGFDRVRVMLEWAWYYVTFKAGERIIAPNSSKVTNQ